MLAALRPSLAMLTSIAAKAGSSISRLATPLSAGWEQRLAMGRLRLTPGQHWLDLRYLSIRETLRAALAPMLVQLGLTDLDAGTIREPRRIVTQAIAAWAYDQGFQGIVYPSRLDDHVTCWAIFEGAAFLPVGAAQAIARDDPDLQATAALFGLVP